MSILATSSQQIESIADSRKGNTNFIKNGNDTITSITTKAIELGDEQTTEIPLNEPEASGQEKGQQQPTKRTSRLQRK